MDAFLYRFFHHETNDRTKAGPNSIPHDPKDWPDAWKTINYKHYRQFAPIPLPKTHTELFQLLTRRKTTRTPPQEVITRETLSAILQCGYGLRESGKTEGRTAPSAGARYPLEVYLILWKPQDSLSEGIYHYGIKENTLEPVAQKKFSVEQVRAFAPAHEWLTSTSGMIVLTGVFGRTTEKYGDRGYRYVLLEAGHVAQNMLLAGVETEVNLVPIGGVDEHVIEDMIALNRSIEQVVYTLYIM